MSPVTITTLIIGLAIVMTIYCLIKKLFKLAISGASFVVICILIYTIAPPHVQSGIQMTLALSTNGVFSQFNDSVKEELKTKSITYNTTGKFTWVEPVVVNVSQAPTLTNENNHTFDIGFFTYEKKVVGYKIHCKYQDVEKIKAKVQSLTK